MRREIKIPINSNLENYFDNWVNFKIKTSKHHNDRLINSIYFDSEDFITAQDNLAGISGRKKYRIRWYNNDDKNINYEIKLKKNNLGQKYSLNSNVKIENLNDLFSIKNENCQTHIFNGSNQRNGHMQRQRNLHVLVALALYFQNHHHLCL